jgi:hypothetical protein
MNKKTATLPVTTEMLLALINDLDIRIRALESSAPPSTPPKDAVAIIYDVSGSVIGSSSVGDALAFYRSLVSLFGIIGNEYALSDKVVPVEQIDSVAGQSTNIPVLVDFLQHAHYSHAVFITDGNIYPRDLETLSKYAAIVTIPLPIMHSVTAAIRRNREYA